MTTPTRRWRTMARGRTLRTIMMSTQTLSEFTAVDARTSLGNRESDPPCSRFLGGFPDSRFPIGRESAIGKRAVSRSAGKRESGSRFGEPGISWSGPDDDSAAPSRCSGSRFGDRGAAGSARLGLAGLGQRSLARHLVPGIAANTAASIRGDRVTRAFLALVSHSATCGGRLGENFGDLGGRTAWAGRKIVEFFGTHR
jgi:hypothetical protein